VFPFFFPFSAWSLNSPSLSIQSWSASGSHILKRALWFTLLRLLWGLSSSLSTLFFMRRWFRYGWNCGICRVPLCSGHSSHDTPPEVPPHPPRYAAGSCFSAFVVRMTTVSWTHHHPSLSFHCSDPRMIRFSPRCLLPRLRITPLCSRLWMRLPPNS